LTYILSTCGGNGMKYSEVSRFNCNIDQIQDCIADAVELMIEVKEDIEFDLNNVTFTMDYSLLKHHEYSIEYLTGWYSCLYMALLNYKIELKDHDANPNSLCPYWSKL
jgi:hypothetical protein